MTCRLERLCKSRGVEWAPSDFLSDSDGDEELQQANAQQDLDDAAGPGTSKSIGTAAAAKVAATAGGRNAAVAGKKVGKGAVAAKESTQQAQRKASHKAATTSSPAVAWDKGTGRQGFQCTEPLKRCAGYWLACVLPWCHVRFPHACVGIDRRIANFMHMPHACSGRVMH